MPQAGIERRIAAILSADIVGFSRLIELDEKHTLAALGTVLSEVVEPTKYGPPGLGSAFKRLPCRARPRPHLVEASPSTAQQPRHCCKNCEHEDVDALCHRIPLGEVRAE